MFELNKYSLPDNQKIDELHRVLLAKLVIMERKYVVTEKIMSKTLRELTEARVS